MSKMISIITPCLNEEESVIDCHKAVEELFKNRLPEYDYEHIFCDNASVDKTGDVLKGIAQNDKNVKVIVNSRNFGALRSMFNGVLNAKGDAVIVMLPADLQDPPELIEDFVRKWEEGYKVVYGVRKNRKESWMMANMRRLYYRLVSRLANVFIPNDAGEFQLIDRVVVETLREFDDYYPYLRGMIASCGYKSIGIDYTWVKRKKGRSKAGILNLLDIGLNGLISFTNVPLRICMYTGFLLSLASLTYALVNFFVHLVRFREFTEPGIGTIIVAIFFFAGIQLLFLGMLGEYICAIHYQVRKRPMVIEAERINF